MSVSLVHLVVGAGLGDEAWYIHVVEGKLYFLFVIEIYFVYRRREKI